MFYNIHTTVNLGYYFCVKTFLSFVAVFHQHCAFCRCSTRTPGYLYLQYFEAVEYIKFQLSGDLLCSNEHCLQYNNSQRYEETCYRYKNLHFIV